MTHFSSLAMRRYSSEPRARKYVKGYGFSWFARKYKRQLLDTGLGSLKTASKKVVDEAGKFLENKIAYPVTKSTNDKISKQEPLEEIIIPLEKRRCNTNRNKGSIITKMEHYKISKLLSNSTVSKFVTKNGSK